jgi:3-oxoacyl-[acyl-carrier protein] reductase
MSITYRFTDKVVLVTGSSRGMGAAILGGFARAGATCILNYFDDPDGQNRRDAESTAQRLTSPNADSGKPGPIHLLEADVRNYESVTDLMHRIAELTGGLDILVNNAGIIRDKTVKKMSADDWQSVIDTNLTGVFHCSKLGAEILRDGGRIVNIS